MSWHPVQPSFGQPLWDPPPLVFHLLKVFLLFVPQFASVTSFLRFSSSRRSLSSVIARLFTSKYRFSFSLSAFFVRLLVDFPRNLLKQPNVSPYSRFCACRKTCPEEWEPIPSERRIWHAPPADKAKKSPQGVNLLPTMTP